MQKGYKRTGKAIAVLHFFIGLIVVAILLVAAYFCLEKMDYSHRINPDTTVRAYVEMTATPEEPEEEPFSADEDSGDEGSDVVDLIPSTTPTLEPTPTIEPTPIATPSPTPTASPTPTPAPTVISSDLISKSRTRGFKVPDPSNEATAALTEVYVSAPNNNKFVHLTGYAYINDASVDAATSHAYLIVMPSDSKKKAAIAYQGTMTPGISGETHAGAQCQNPANADFDVILSVANFKDAQYTLGVVLQYEKNGKNAFTYYQFPQTLNVANGAIVLTEGAVSATLTETTENADVVGQPVVDAGAMNETATDDLDGTAFGDGGASAFDETAAEGQEANLADAGVSVG